MPVVDLGPGCLHGNREPPANQRKNAGGGRKGHDSKNGRRSKINNHIDDEDNDNDTHQESSRVEGTPHPPLPRRGSAGNIENRIRQGKNAVWGGRGAPGSGTRSGGGNSSGGGGDGGGGDWWDTGTPYAFQPRLSADKTTVLSLVGTAGRRHRGVVGLDQRDSLRGKCGDSDDDSRPAPRAESVASELSVQHQQQQLLQGAHGASRELMRIVRVPESNEHHGQRVFFLA